MGLPGQLYRVFLVVPSFMDNDDLENSQLWVSEFQSCTECSGWQAIVGKDGCLMVHSIIFYFTWVVETLGSVYEHTSLVLFVIVNFSLKMGLSALPWAFYMFSQCKNTFVVYVETDKRKHGYSCIVTMSFQWQRLRSFSSHQSLGCGTM